MRDLQVWGGVGEHQLAWVRSGNSRYTNGVSWLGSGHNWRHSYQWEMTVSTDASGPLKLDLYYPDGTYNKFTRRDTVNWEFHSSPAVTEILFLNAARDTFTVRKANGWRYIFKKVGTGWQLGHFLDSQQNA